MRDREGRKKEASKVMQIRHEFFVPSSADLPIPVPLEVSGHNVRFVLSVEVSQVLVLQSRTPAMPDETGWKSDIYMFTYMDTYIILHTCSIMYIYIHVHVHVAFICRHKYMNVYIHVITLFTQKIDQRKKTESGALNH